jgi:YggT family protein
MTNLAYFIEVIFQIMTFAIFFRVIMSWFMMSPSSMSGFAGSIYQVLYTITEPILGPIRRIVPTIGMFDISPIVAIVLIQILDRIIVGALIS